MRKQAILAVTAAAFLAMQATAAYADVIGITEAPGSSAAAVVSGMPGALGGAADLSDAPGGKTENTAKATVETGSSSVEGILTGTAAPSDASARPSLGPMALPDGSSFGPGGSTEPQESIGGSMDSSAESWISDVPGGMHLNDAGTDVSLGFKLVSPNVWRGGAYAAEGSVQLADGSWAEISLSDAIDAPYFRVLREETDSTGTAWYVCASYASQIGNYRTPDGSFPRELWLKKSDCRETASLHLNTTNPKRINVVRTALANLGKQYSYAGNGPDAFDCSGFVSYVFAQAGISVPRQSSAICAMQEQISLAQLRPGDIVGRPGHVGIYIGDGIFVHSSESETGVVSERIDVYNRTSGFTNYVNVLGD